MAVIAQKSAELIALPTAPAVSTTVPPVSIPPTHISHSKRHSARRWLFWIALGVLLAVGGAFWRAHLQNEIRYETLPIEYGSVQASITATGTLNAVVNVQVGSQVSGNIKALYADFNTKVKRGQLVALIDPEMFQAQVNQAEGAVGSARAAVVTAQAQVEKAKADLTGAIANKRNLESVKAKDLANTVNAQLQWQRAEFLVNAGVYSQQDYDSAKAAYDAYQAQMAADGAQIDAADQTIQSNQAQVRVTLAQSASAQAQQRQAESALAQAKINLAHTRIVAPVSGTVIARHMDVGQTVAASFQAPDIFDIAQDLTKMQVDTNVDESDIGGIRTGQSATFSVDAYPGTTFHGPVVDVRKAPINTQNVITYDVVIAVSNPDIRLFPGMTANVTILTARQEDVLKVPNAALRFHPSADVLKQAGLPPSQAGAQQIYVLTGGKLKHVAVKFGLSDGKFTATTAADLKSGDLVIVRAITQAQSPSGTAPSTVRRLPGV